MTHVTYIEADGREQTLDIQEGWSLLQAAFAHGISGLIGECGGACSCGTCHCYVQQDRLQELPPPSAGELEMLEFVASERRDNSRLACQIRVAPHLEGLVVHLPDTQT
ncbi:2Fe-2S iron-sulfur cluster-binding protein [Caenimonas koreensis]|uniref:2Fe-2S iron-sulfur cluster-binding protein n=1 Tax=Caenimonas koreensis TaxID=367474 RepID=UPI0037835CF4